MKRIVCKVQPKRKKYVKASDSDIETMFQGFKDFALELDSEMSDDQIADFIAQHLVEYDYSDWYDIALDWLNRRK